VKVEVGECVCRLKTLASQLSKFHVFIDSKAELKLLDENPLAGKTWSVHVEVDCGYGRCELDPIRFFFVFVISLPQQGCDHYDLFAYLFICRIIQWSSGVRGPMRGLTAFFLGNQESLI